MTTELATTGANELAFTQEQMKVLRETVAADLSPAEFSLFGQVIRRTGLDPFAKQIYAIARGSGQYRKVTFQTGIDGYRLIAERTGEYEGQDDPEWCGEDGNWTDVWLKQTPPAAARVRVYRRGRRPATGIALYREYVQKDRDGNPLDMWRKMPANQLAKCAESLAIRKAFANEVGGVYTHDEMAQAESEEGSRDVTPRPSRSEQIEAGRTAIREKREEQAAKPAPQPPSEHDWMGELVELMAPHGGVKSLAGMVDGQLTKNALKRLFVEHGIPTTEAAKWLYESWKGPAPKDGPDPDDEPFAYTDDGRAVDEDGVIEGEAIPMPLDPDDGPLEDAPSVSGFREGAIIMFDFLSKMHSKPVGVNHAVKALGLKSAKNVGEAWKTLDAWAAQVDADMEPVAVLRSALTAHLAAE